MTFDGSYSLQRSIANYLNTQNPYDVLSHWSNDGVTMRQYAVISGSWNLPFGKDQRYLSNATGIVKTAATGWVYLNQLPGLGVVVFTLIYWGRSLEHGNFWRPAR